MLVVQFHLNDLKRLILVNFLKFEDFVKSTALSISLASFRACSKELFHQLTHILSRSGFLDLAFKISEMISFLNTFSCVNDLLVVPVLLPG